MWRGVAWGRRVKFLGAGCEETRLSEVIIGSLCYPTAEEDLDSKRDFLQDHFYFSRLSQPKSFVNSI
jgi:hypothetical protein